MSSPLPSKRRKLNDATARLSKPFVSPLRTSKSDSTPLREHNTKANLGPPAYIPSTLAHTIKAACSVSESTNADSRRNTGHRPVLKATPARKPLPTPWSTKRQADPEVIAAQKAVNAMELQIKKIQNEIDALKQAHAIANSSTDADLEELTDKWRLASQAVAEELFGSVKERVQRMGGVAAWREMEKKKYDRSHGLGEFAQEEPESDDADCEFDSEGEELPEDEQEYRKKMKRQAKKEMMEAADVPEQPEEEPEANKKTQVWAEAGKDDDTFTMDMMLRSLNIELGVIGYDKEYQRWII